MPTTILVSGYFGGDGHDRKIDYFERLNDALASIGARLVLYDLSPDRVATALPLIKANYGQTLAKHLPDRMCPTLTDNVELLRAAECEAAIWVCSPRQGLARIEQFARDFRRVLQTLTPARVLLWHQFNGLHHIARDLCRASSIPAVFIEYGELPGTVAMSVTGQMGLSLPAQDPIRFAQQPVPDETAQAIARYIDRMANERRTRKPQEASDATRATLDRLRTRGKPVVLYAGQNDPQAGLVPAWHPDARIHSPHYESTVDALEHLAEIACDRDWSLVFKPHPRLAERHARLAERFPGITVIQRGDIFDCIEAADVVVTLVSQVAYLSLIRSKATVVLGRIALSRSGCVYEVEQPEKTGVEIQKAVDRGLTPAHLAARNRHFAQLLDHSLFTMDPDLEEVLERTPDDAAGFILSDKAGAAAPSGTVYGADTGRPISASMISLLGFFAGRLRTVYRM